MRFCLSFIPKLAKAVYLIGLLFSVFCAPVMSVDIKETEQDYIQAQGVHGLTIFSHNNTFYASYLPNVFSVNAHQILFSFTVDVNHAEELTALMKSEPLVTLKPEPFDLIQFIDNEIPQFSADVYQGYFKQNEAPVFNNVKIKVEALLLVSNIQEGANYNYYLIPVRKDKGLLIHKIGQLPTFDQIAVVDISNADSNSSSTNNSTNHAAKNIPVSQSVNDPLLDAALLHMHTSVSESANAKTILIKHPTSEKPLVLSDKLHNPVTPISTSTAHSTATSPNNLDETVYETLTVSKIMYYNSIP